MSTKGKRPMHQYSEESMKIALNEIRKGTTSISGASKKYGVPRTTIQDRIHGRIADGSRKMGPKTVLTDAEEQRLAKWCGDLAKCGFPLKAQDLLNTVQKIVKEDQRTTPFVNGKPGRKWYLGFLKRHPNLCLREAEGICKGRAVITQEYIRKWFEELKTFLTEENALDILDDPSRMFNGDETSFSMCPKTGKVLAPKGYKNVYTIQKGNEKETITVLLVFSANGQTVVPMVVFPYVRPPKDVVNSLPENWFLGKSETGWMVSETFFEYIVNGVHIWLNEHNIQRPILLFVDGHKSHMTLELSKFCESNGIILYALPPNTTHIMQPADVSVFKPLKLEWKKTVREWQMKQENSNKVVSKSTFCPLLNMVLSNINLGDTIKNGFRKCGLYPFNPENVDYTKCVQNQSELLGGGRNDNDTTYKATDCDIAIEIINKIATSLRERGINSDVIVEEICRLKQTGNDQTVEILGDVTIQSGTYVINEKGVLEMQTKNKKEPTLPSGHVHCLSPTNSKDDLFAPNYSSSPVPLILSEKIQTFESITDCMSPISSVSDTINNVFKSISYSPSTGATVIKNEAISMSPTFEKHLYFPKLSKSSRFASKPKAPSAISALAWRNHIEAKENEKLAKAEAIKSRKLQRQKRKMENENKLKKVKTAKKKQVCNTCEEDLDTDTEDNALKNVGCDNCPQWFHLKCTILKELAYEDAIEMDFMCEACKPKQTEGF